MKKVIFQYQIDLESKIEIVMPESAKPLYVALRDGEPYLWCEANMDDPPRTFRFLWFGSAQSMPDHMQYIGTVMPGSFVFHLYQDSLA